MNTVTQAGLAENVEGKAKKIPAKGIVIGILIFLFLGGFYQLATDVKAEMREASVKYDTLQNFVAGRLFLSFKDKEGKEQIAPVSGVANVKQQFELTEEEKVLLCK